MAVDKLFTCGSCGYEVSGYTAADLKKDQGWEWHTYPGGTHAFVMCGDCEREYALRRELKARAAEIVGDAGD